MSGLIHGKGLLDFTEGYKIFKIALWPNIKLFVVLPV